MINSFLGLWSTLSLQTKTAMSWFSNRYAARLNDRAILKLCKRCLLSIYIYILNKWLLAL
jgi:hypothetical protein